MTLIDQLIAQGLVLTDGAWGTQLQERGLPVGACPDLWNLSHAEKVAEVAAAYVQAGSRIILTNTFGANRITLDRHGASSDVGAINREGAAISVAAAGNRALVFASIGPSGAMLAMGEVEEDDLRRAFSEQATALAAGGAHALLIETMSDLDEACLAVQAAAETGLPVVACMVYDSGAGKDRTMMGVTPEQAAEGLTAAGASVIGANCGNGIEGYIPVSRRLRAATSLPLWIKANAGLPEMVAGRAVYSTPPATFASHVPALVEAGAGFVGGCCGTTPAHIAAVAELLQPAA